ncbi:MAG TPA: PEP-CTERM sorting domain-containing protein [Verrucomicrobiota bacterium]|nr:PEP-CTERM sorting domain-containing protein [Verrucomicrobiota bacterium]
MKKLMVIAVACICSTWANAQSELKAQFNMKTYIEGVLLAPVYLPEPSNPTVPLYGNAPDGLPPGTTIYNGGKVTGTAYTAEMWWGTVADENSLQPVPSSKWYFRTAKYAGYLAQSGPNGENIALVVPGVAPGTTVWMQLRVWDNKGGTITSWDDAVAYWNSCQDLNYAIGKSELFQNTLGGGLSAPSDLDKFRSFSLYTNVPEPATIALLGLGGLGLLFRRRK